MYGRGDQWAHAFLSGGTDNQGADITGYFNSSIEGATDTRQFKSMVGENSTEVNGKHGIKIDLEEYKKIPDN